jgi:ATP-binding cassette subfamily B protein
MQECTQRGSADNKSTQSDKNSSKLKLNVNDINNGELKLHINNENNNKVNMKDNNNRNYNNKNSGIWQLFLRTMRTMGKRRFMYYGSILGMSITFAMFSVMEAFLMKVVVDIAQKGEWDRLISSVVIIVIVGVIVLLGYRFACIRYNVEAKRIYGKLYEQVLSHEMKLPCEYYENHHSGEMLSKVSFDLGRMGDIFGSRFRRVVMPFMMVVVFLVPMFVLSWQLTLCLVAVNTVLIGVTMVLTGPLKSLSKKMSESNSIMTKHITDLIQGIIQVRMFPAGRKTVDRYNEEADVYAVKSDKRNMFSSLLECANTGFDLICNLVFLALGILFVQKGYTTLGAIAAIYTMYGRFSRQFLQMGKYIPELIAYLTYAQNIFEFLDEKTEEEMLNRQEFNKERLHNEINNSCGHNNIFNNIDYSVKISDLTFSYIKDENNAPVVVLDNYNERIKSGEFVAVTGASGSGKTTLSKLLMGFYKPDRGMIEVCGNNLDDISLQAGRSFFALVPQDAILFNMSIMDNIRMGRLDATKDEIIEAAKMANAHQFITEFTDGYDTVVGEKGMSVSGGQRQRIAIARAILKNAPIMLMDEATSALDNESERAVNETLQNLKGRMTIIMIAHRTSTIQMADRVISL